MALYGAPVEYALHTLLNLCLAPADIPHSAKDLAEFQQLPVPFMRKLLTQLQRADLVRAGKGVRGGWMLARAPEDISVLAVADAAQGGRHRVFECKNVRARCVLWGDGTPPPSAVSGTCEIHAVMLKAEKELRKSLAAQSLADIAARVNSKTGGASSVVIKGWFNDRFATRRDHKQGAIDE
jgi:Rrf2 family protein